MTSRPNYLRSETSTNAEQYRQAGATSATTVKAPKEIYEAMQKMREKTNTGPGRQLLEALRHDPLGGDPYDGDTDTRPKRGPTSGTNGTRVALRIPTDEFIRIQEISHTKDIPIAQLLLNAWKREHNWKTPPADKR